VYVCVNVYVCVRVGVCVMECVYMYIYTCPNEYASPGMVMIARARQARGVNSAIIEHRDGKTIPIDIPTKKRVTASCGRLSEKAENSDIGTKVPPCRKISGRRPR